MITPVAAFVTATSAPCTPRRSSSRICPPIEADVELWDDAVASAASSATKIKRWMDDSLKNAPFHDTTRQLPLKGIRK